MYYKILYENFNFYKVPEIACGLFLKTKSGKREFYSGANTWCRYCCLMTTSSIFMFLYQFFITTALSVQFGKLNVYLKPNNKVTEFDGYP